MNATAANDGSATEQAQRSTIFVHGAGRRLNTNVFFARAAAERLGEPVEVPVVGAIHPGYQTQRDEDGFDLYGYMQMIELAEMAVILQKGSRFLDAELELALDLSNRHSAQLSILDGGAALWQRIEEILPASGSQITFLLRDQNLHKPDFDILAELIGEASAAVRLQSSKALYIADRSGSGWSPFLLDHADVAEALSSAFPIHALRFIGELPHEALVHEHTLLAAHGVMHLLNLTQSLDAPLQVLFDIRDGANPTLELAGDSSDFIIALEDRVLNYGLKPVEGWEYQKLSGLFDLLSAHQEIGYDGVGYGILSYGTLLELGPSHWSVQR